jgi:hypothetical protein
LQRQPHRMAARSPPILRRLLRPPRLRRRKWGVLVRPGPKDVPALVHHQRARAARPDINPKKLDVSLRES